MLERVLRPVLAMSLSDGELLDLLKLQNETALRRIARMVEFMGVVAKNEAQILRTLEEDTEEPVPPASADSDFPA